MKNEETIKNLSEEVKKKLAACETREEVKKVLAEAGVEPLDDGDLDKVAGGCFDLWGREGRYDPPAHHTGSYYV